MDCKTLRLEQRGHVAWVYIDMPERANALAPAFWNEFPALLDDLDRKDEVRVVVLAGEGRNFCAGADIALLEGLIEMGSVAECAAKARDTLRREILRLQEAFTAIERLRVPVIAAVHGACIGAGVDLISACDLRYASEEARFCIKEVDFGIVADVGTLQRLRHVIGLPAVMELSLTGETFDVAKARSLGMLNAVCADKESLHAEVQAIAERIAAKPPLTVRGIKHNLLYARDHSVAEGLDYVATWNASALLNEECANAVSLARAKRGM